MIVRAVYQHCDKCRSMTSHVVKTGEIKCKRCERKTKLAKREVYET